MKNYTFALSDDDYSGPMDFPFAFALSDKLSEIEMYRCVAVKESPLPIERRLQWIEHFKKHVTWILLTEETSPLLREYFHVDGAIKFNEGDRTELQGMFVWFDKDGNMGKPEDSMFDTYMMNLINDFTYFRGDELIFRNQNFYFLFPSLTVDTKERFSSINDYRITDIDIQAFTKDFLTHYNTIDQNILLFKDYFHGALWQGLEGHFTEFLAEIRDILDPDKLTHLRSLIDHHSHTWNAEVDAGYVDQWHRAVDRLEHFRDMVNAFDQHRTPHMFSHLTEFISEEAPLLQYAKVSLSVDIDGVFNKHLKVEVKKSMKKMLLGLLDAKINMLAFMQNATQIMCNEQFMNPEYEGSLVLNADAVRNIRKVCPKEFAAFKELQKKWRESDSHHTLLTMLDAQVGYFIDVLIGNNDISYVKATGELPADLPEIIRWKTDMMREELHGSILILESFFGLMDSYVKAWEAKAEKKGKKDTTSQKPAHMLNYETALKKLIRLYREENDPLVMIKTAQNALNVIIQKGYEPKKDVLHLMGVNYGWTLVGLYAKNVFAKTIVNGQVLANSGNIVYSIYDVKNANDFLKLVDYPFSKIIKNDTIDEQAKKNISDKNWLLIFDDNTNSGETLDNLRLSAQQSGFYPHIDVFACRASYNMNNYKKSLKDEEKLDFVIHSAIPARKSKVNPEGGRYKELLGTIVGNRIHKILYPNGKE